MVMLPFPLRAPSAGGLRGVGAHQDRDRVAQTEPQAEESGARLHHRSVGEPFIARGDCMVVS